MLRRVLLMIAALVLAIPAQFALANESDTMMNDDGELVVVAGESGQPASSNSGQSPESALAPRVCVNRGAETVPCSSSSGFWVGKPHFCYMSEYEYPPPKSDPIWGSNSDGVIMLCVSKAPDGVSQPLWKLVWMPSSSPEADPEVLALKAVERMMIRAVRIATVPNTLEQDPKSMGIVGVSMWMWVEAPDEQTWGPVTKSVTAGSVTTTATAKVQRIVWDMGNGDKVTCRTPGEKWASWKGAIGQKPSPNCGYQYEREGDYTITATTYWRVDWTGAGRTGVLEFTRTSTAHTVVGEVQVVNVHR